MSAVAGRRTLAVLAAIAAVSTLPGSAAAQPPAAVTPAPPAVAAGPGAPTLGGAWVATVTVPVVATAAPGGGLPVQRLGSRAPWNGGPLRLLVLQSRIDAGGARWIRVLLARRPNGTSGWIPAAKATLARTVWRIDVDRVRRQVLVRREGRVIRRFPAVVGAPATPTPGGLFAIAESVLQPDPRGFVGTWALHLVAFSNVLDDFGGGPGRIGLHGRGPAARVDALGTARSNGCIRLSNEAIGWIARRAREGTPVRIR